MTALGLDELLAHDNSVVVHDNVTAALNIGDVVPAALQSSANGSVTIVKLASRDDGNGAATLSQLAAQPDVAVVSTVMVLRNYGRSFLEAKALLQPVVQSADAVLAQHAAAVGPPVPVVDIAVPWSRRLQQSAAVPLFGIFSATAMALATCGNGVCEFGEAVGTWAYPESWHCRQDCPYDLHACPMQVLPPQTHRCLLWKLVTTSSSRSHPRASCHVRNWTHTLRLQHAVSNKLTRGLGLRL